MGEGWSGLRALHLNMGLMGCVHSQLLSTRTQGEAKVWSLIWTQVKEGMMGTQAGGEAPDLLNQGP